VSTRFEQLTEAREHGLTAYQAMNEAYKQLARTQDELGAITTLPLVAEEEGHMAPYLRNQMQYLAADLNAVAAGVYAMLNKISTVLNQCTE